MSVVTLQIGQCGNQLGYEFFKTIAQDIDAGSQNGIQQTKYCQLSRERFFGSTVDGDLVARAVLVDTESKVVSKTVSDACRGNTWHYPKGACYTQKQGAGNNWAYGYFGHADLGLREILDAVRRQTEACDWLGAFLPTFSLGGGTGSGLGTRITEALGDAYPRTPLLNLMVWPFSTGEVAVQTYNTLLSLSHLQEASDVLLLLSNDQLYNVVSKRWALKDASLSVLNALAAQQLACFLQPSRMENGSIAELGDVGAELASHPQLKLVTLRHVPQEFRESFGRHTWLGLVSSLRRMLQYHSVADEGMDERARNSFPASVANLLVARGDDLSTLDIGPLISAPTPRARFVPPERALTTWTSSHRYMSSEKMAVLANNGQGCLPLLEQVAERAWGRFVERAYLHHYTRHGLEEEHFAEGFLQLEQIVEAYKQLADV